MASKKIEECVPSIQQEERKNCCFYETIEKGKCCCTNNLHSSINEASNQEEVIDNGQRSVKLLMYQNKGRGLKPHSTPATLIWLEQNYEMAEGVCIPRNTLYQHYVEFCARQFLNPVNAASFGKVIEKLFYVINCLYFDLVLLLFWYKYFLNLFLF